MALPILIKRVSHFKQFQPLSGRTRDISIHGVYFTLDREVSLGTTLDFSLRLPQGAEARIDAQARIVRVERRPRNTAERVGLAAKIEKYKLVWPEAQ